MPRLPSSTAFRFAAFYSLAFTLLIIALGASFYWAIRSQLRYELDQRIVTERQALLVEAQHGGVDAIVTERAEHERGDMRYALFARDGKLSAGRSISALPPLGWSKMWFIEDDGDLDATRGFTSRMADGRLLVVGADPEAMEELDEQMLPLFALAFGLIALIGIGGAFVLSSALRNRLDSINRTAEAIIGGDLDRRMPLTGSGDEFDRLSATLNMMLDRVDALLGNLRQVSGDIAHDLRTPLSRLRQKLELALAGNGGEAPLREAMLESVEQTDDMLALFAAILSISEVEAGGAGVRMRPFDMSLLIADIAESYLPSAEDIGGTIGRQITPGIEIEGNRELVAQLTVNLLDNVLRHTPAGTAIGVTLAANEETIDLIVEDNGPGIAAEEREFVFARFTRLERSRSTPGHGLGLNLVAAIAKAHGGTISLLDNHPGVKMVVSFPRRTG